MSATFQCTRVKFNQLYLVGLRAKVPAIGLPGKLWKSGLTRLKFHDIWSSRFGDMWQKVQHMQTPTVSAASRKRLPLSYFLNT